MIVWLLGDLCNLIGAVLAGLLPTVIILALYVSCSETLLMWWQLNDLDLQYTICDIILLFQIYFYRWARTKHVEPKLITPEHDTEETSLLVAPLVNNTDKTDCQRLLKIFAQYSAAILFVFASGVISWWISTRSQAEDGVPQSPSEPEISEWKIQLIGWASAILYCKSYARYQERWLNLYMFSGSARAADLQV